MSASFSVISCKNDQQNALARERESLAPTKLYDSVMTNIQQTANQKPMTQPFFGDKGAFRWIIPSHAKGDFQKISIMSHKEFLDFMEFLHRCPKPTELNHSEITQLKKSMLDQRAQHAASNTLIIANMPGPSHDALITLPICYRAPKSIIPKYFFYNQELQLFLALPAVQAFQARSECIPDINILNHLVKQLFQLSEILVWDYPEDGCKARATLISRLFIACGIPQNRMSKIYVFSLGDKLNRSLFAPGHIYHVAIAVRLQDKTLRMVDPFIDRNQALGLSEWLSRQGVASHLINNCTAWLEKIKNPPYFSYPCTQGPDQVFKCISRPINTIHATKSVEPDEEQLCSYQWELEQNCIETFFDSLLPVKT